MLVIILVVQQLEGNVLSPILQSNAMNLHPVIVLLVVSAGGTLYGIIGAFLAVPCAAIIAVIIRYIVESWDERAKIVVKKQPATQPETKMARWLRQRSGSLRNFVQDGRTTSPAGDGSTAATFEAGALVRTATETANGTAHTGDDDLIDTMMQDDATGEIVGHISTRKPPLQTGIVDTDKDDGEKKDD